jgi:hypothetical protein
LAQAQSRLAADVSALGTAAEVGRLVRGQLRLDLAALRLAPATASALVDASSAVPASTLDNASAAAAREAVHRLVQGDRAGAAAEAAWGRLFADDRAFWSHPGRLARAAAVAADVQAVEAAGGDATATVKRALRRAGVPWVVWSQTQIGDRTLQEVSLDGRVVGRREAMSTP